MRTTDHEKRRMEDAQIICRLAQVYRCGLDWARLQKSPYAELETAVVAEYTEFFEKLQVGGVRLMLVLHHFCHPTWFEKSGAFERADNVPVFVDYCTRVIQHFGKYAHSWNTFNEPNVFVMNGYLLGNFPPFLKRRYRLATRVLTNMGSAHNNVYKAIHTSYPDALVGISLNTACFTGTNLLGTIVAYMVDWWFHKKSARPFEKVDFWGLSYYAHMPFDPFPIDAVSRRAALVKLGLPHDEMWAYKPEGLGQLVRRFYRRYQLPVYITENGVCTNSVAFRIQSIRDYLKICHMLVEEGIPLHGYVHWSAWDNFEWHLGTSYRFGLVRVDFESMDRHFSEAAQFYENIVKTNTCTT
jgi:beta-glucosidase